METWLRYCYHVLPVQIGQDVRVNNSNSNNNTRTIFIVLPSTAPAICERVHLSHLSESWSAPGGLPTRSPYCKLDLCVGSAFGAVSTAVVGRGVSLTLAIPAIVLDLINISFITVNLVS